MALEGIVFDTWYSGRTVLLGDGEFFEDLFSDGIGPWFETLIWLLFSIFTVGHKIRHNSLLNCFNDLTKH